MGPEKKQQQSGGSVVLYSVLSLLCPVSEFLRFVNPKKIKK
ncbi:MAG: hypothetical protein SCK29_04075 [Bacillota bacterium]|nr:hypothetical protein [Bacillota bacterium]